jgi:hypothetical protein
MTNPEAAADQTAPADERMDDDEFDRYVDETSATVRNAVVEVGMVRGASPEQILFALAVSAVYVVAFCSCPDHDKIVISDLCRQIKRLMKDYRDHETADDLQEGTTLQ